MLFTDFHSKIKKLNSHLWVDVDRETRQRDPEFPTAGLYYDNRFIMGIPHEYVPEYSVSAVDYEQLIFDGDFEEIKRINETGFAKDEKILWRGWRAIVHGLIKMGYTTRAKAERVFNTYFEPYRPELPRNYINREL